MFKLLWDILTVSTVGLVLIFGVLILLGQCTG